MLEDINGSKWSGNESKKSQAKKATIVFIDESGILMSPIVRRTWSPRGQTPLVRHATRSHKKVTAIGAVTVRYHGRGERIMFRLLKARNVKSAECIQFLIQFKQNIRGHIIVVWDRLQAHRSKALQRWLSNQKRVETEFFPPYAPKLNPVEYLWSYLKATSLANFAPQDIDDLFDEAKSSICAIRQKQNLIRSFIEHSPANSFA
ncbi:MAG TPA: IS630 family transposase [Bdellovibrionales bacterium]|nr:IS630 family transposase [Bdellovibrionales bacterium]